MAFLPLKCRRYLDDRGVDFQEVEAEGQKALLLKNVFLPVGHFDAPVADVLILLPTSYPDSAPDMFYTLPWLRLASSTTYPRAADIAHSYLGQSWQRWSRHNNQWRPGIDGIWTMLKRIETAMEVAA